MVRRVLIGRLPWSHLSTARHDCSIRIGFLIHSSRRGLTTDGRTRISNLWIPIPKTKPNPKESQQPDADDVHSLLVKAGYIRNAYPGVFHMLPLGLRVQEKIEKIIDKNMKAIGASKTALPSISAHSLWQKTGRVEKMGKELFQFKDRHGTQYLLGPTHEEEITALVSSTVTSYKHLPLRVYQITRKYRDERRPRAGLLRGREFVMKDLYSFDSTLPGALVTYNDVTDAYKAIFEEISLPFLWADADTGAMGGSLSHEYHYPCNTGEDTVISCSGDNGCEYTANVECADILPIRKENWELKETKVWYGVSKDRKVLVKAYYPGQARLVGSEFEEWVKREVNPRVVQNIVKDEGGGLETGMEESSALNAWEENFTAWEDTLDSDTGQIKEGETFSRILKIYDGHLLDGDGDSKFSTFSDHEEDFSAESPGIIKQFHAQKKIPTIVKTTMVDENGQDVQIFLCKPRTGDTCPDCLKGELTATKTTELGHTFFLGTRYSGPLKAQVGYVNEKGEQSQINMQMGCYGIGVTRLIAAIAEVMRDEKGLCWPKVVAPYSVIVVHTGKKGGEAMKERAEEVYDAILQRNRSLEDDIVLDDRDESLGRKLKEADLVGYSVVVVVGNKFEEEGLIEVQERRTGAKYMVNMEEMSQKLESILD